MDAHLTIDESLQQQIDELRAAVIKNLQPQDTEPTVSEPEEKMGVFDILFMICILVMALIGVLFTIHHTIQFIQEAPEAIDRYLEQRIERVLEERSRPALPFFELKEAGELQQKGISYRVLRTRET